MKHAVIVAHPNRNSLTCAAAEAYAGCATALGHQVLVRDLYRLDFDPCLKAGEIPGPAGFEPAPDAAAERQKLQDIDVFAFIYPLWFNAPPAMLKGYVDRIFSAGFGFEPGSAGARPLLNGRRMISFTFSGAPDAWVKETGALDALTTLFDRHVAQMCGLRVIDHVHVGGIVPGITPEAFEDVLDTVRRSVRGRFGDAAAH